MGQYRRIQVARHLVDEGIAGAGGFRYDSDDRIVSFGVDDRLLEEVVSEGTAFRTSGCPGRDGCVACNRPFANSRPGPDIRNYPFALEADDVSKVRGELWS
jgi:biotin synthase